LALLGWALWRPTRSKARLWLIEGLYLWMRLAMWACLIAVVGTLVTVGFKLGAMAPAVPFVVGGGCAWLLQRGLDAWVVRQHHRSGVRSLVDPG
jgi:hypothetical protein